MSPCYVSILITSSMTTLAIRFIRTIHNFDCSQYGSPAKKQLYLNFSQKNSLPHLALIRAESRANG